MWLQGLLLIPLHRYVIPHAAPGLVPPPFRKEKQLPWAAHLHSQALRRLRVGWGGGQGAGGVGGMLVPWREGLGWTWGEMHFVHRHKYPISSPSGCLHPLHRPVSQGCFLLG